MDDLSPSGGELWRHGSSPGPDSSVELKLPPGFVPIVKAPSLFTVSGCGTRIYTVGEAEPGGRVLLGTLYYVFCYIPLHPLRSYLYTESLGNYRFFAEGPPVKKANKLARAVGLMFLLFIGAVGVMAHMLDANSADQARIQDREAAVANSRRKVQAAAAEDHIARARAALGAKDFKTGLAEAEAGLTAARGGHSVPDQVTAGEYRAEALEGLGRFGEAAQAYEEQLKLHPHDQHLQDKLEACKGKSLKSK